VPTRLPIFDEGLTQAVSEVLAQTGWPGLTNTEIDSLLSMIKTVREPGANKRDSLFRTLQGTQVRQGCGNVLSAFVARAMDNTRYTRDPIRREKLADELGPILALHGLSLHDSGRLARGTRAKDLHEAAALAGSLRSELLRRGAHVEVLRYCSDELVAQSLFHAMSEASKSIPDRIRLLAASGLDGADLFDDVLGTKTLVSNVDSRTCCSAYMGTFAILAPTGQGWVRMSHVKIY
jgi:Protein of unknown function (Hypoth_ymh)